MTALKAGILRADEGEVLGSGPVRDRFMVDAVMTAGRFSLVQHLFDGHGLAAPMHRHRNEDEFTFVLSGRVGAVLGGVEFEAGPGDLLYKPRDQWHTFWNAGAEPAAVLEIISMGGLEELFRAMDQSSEELSPDDIARMGARYGCDIDMDATMATIERHNLRF